MRRRPRIAIPPLLLAAWLGLGGHRAPKPLRFETIEVSIESGANALAAWQLDIAAPGSGARIVGIEGGEHRVFADPPWYDPAAMDHDRVIIAAFSTAASQQLPNGRTHVATIHYTIDADRVPDWQAQLTAAATAGGAEIPAAVSLVPGTP